MWCASDATGIQWQPANEPANGIVSIVVTGMAATNGIVACGVTCIPVASLTDATGMCISDATGIQWQPANGIANPVTTMDTIPLVGCH